MQDNTLKITYNIDGTDNVEVRYLIDKNSSNSFKNIYISTQMSKTEFTEFITNLKTITQNHDTKVSNGEY